VTHIRPDLDVDVEVDGARRPPADVVAASTVAVPRPHAQKVGRRAAANSSDTIDRPAGGRRAKAGPRPTEVQSDPIDVSPSAETEVVAERHVSTATGSITEVELPEAADVVPASDVASATTVVPLGTVAPPAVPKTVSRRRLRATALHTDSHPGAPADSVTTAPASGTPSAPGTPGSPGTPGAHSGTSSANPTRSSSSGRRGRRGDVAKSAFSLVAMLFAAGIAVATTLPASALHAAGDPSSTSLVASVAEAAAPQPGQELTTSAEVAVSSVSRDGYGVRDVAALRAAGYRIADTFTNNPNGAIQWPFPVGVPISDYFGHRESPGGIGSTDHKGVDFTPGQGTPIQSIADGVVSFVQPSDNGGLGVHVIIDHVIDGQKVSSVYGHMLTGSIEVTEGQVLKVAQTIGRVGNTGTSTGAHLHLEIRLDGTTPVDPYAWLRTHAV
jgi:murein DD-endopeptidase MepM/ murein hydrolase activator NlpD